MHLTTENAHDIRKSLDALADWRVPALTGAAVIAIAFFGIGGWSMFAKLDSAVVAHGQVSVHGSRKVVQHLEGGQVAEILVSSDDRVSAGDVLMRIDPIETDAGLGILVGQKQSLLAEEARLMAEIDGLDAVVFPEGLNASVISDQERRFRESLSSRRNKVGIIESQIEQTTRQIAAYGEQVAGNDAQLASLNAEYDQLKPLLEEQLVAASRGREMERRILDAQTRGATLEAEIERLNVLIEESRIEIEQVHQEAIEASSARLSEVRTTLAEISEREAVAASAAARSELKAPVSGRIVALAVRTVGQVVRPGETVLEIVPDEADLEVTARMSPLDVTHVHPGLVAEIRLPSFKANQTPVAMGEVLSVSADVVTDQATNQSYYELKVSMDGEGFPEQVREALVAGMPAEVVVATGERTVLAYLTQPMMDAMRVGMREH